MFKTGNFFYTITGEFKSATIEPFNESNDENVDAVMFLANEDKSQLARTNDDDSIIFVTPNPEFVDETKIKLRVQIKMFTQDNEEIPHYVFKLENSDKYLSLFNRSDSLVIMREPETSLQMTKIRVDEVTSLDGVALPLNATTDPRARPPTIYLHLDVPSQPLEAVSEIPGQPSDTPNEITADEIIGEQITGEQMTDEMRAERKAFIIQRLESGDRPPADVLENIQKEDPELYNFIINKIAELDSVQGCNVKQCISRIKNLTMEQINNLEDKDKQFLINLLL